jgi:hypothetical protein
MFPFENICIAYHPKLSGAKEVGEKNIIHLIKKS